MRSSIPICVFAKPPRPGEVKTRLAAEIGEAEAAKFAEAFLHDTWSHIGVLPWARPVLAFTEESTAGALEPVWLQGKGDLGRRLTTILCRGLSGAKAAIAIGADTPGLPYLLLEDARRALEHHGSVLGPSEDGGFYLLGLRSCPADLFKGVTWSHRTTFEQVLHRLEEAHLDPFVLDRWFDVDTYFDLLRLHELIESGRVEAPRTAAILNRLRAARAEVVA